MKRLYVRILLWVLGLIVLAQLAVMGFFVVTRGGKGGRFMRQHVSALSRYLADDIAGAGAKGEAARDARMLEVAERIELQISLHDAQGRLLAHAGGEPLPPPPPRAAGASAPDGGTALSLRAEPLRSSDGKERRRFVATVPYPGGGTLQMTSQHGGFESHAGELALAFAGLALLVGLLLIPLARRITRPLRELEAAAQALANGQLDRRVTVTTKDEIGSLARTFNTMADRIATALQQEKDLVTAVSHELRAPLARVRMASELLVDSPELPADARRHVASIGEEIDALDSLIDELITRAKLESAGFELESAACDLVELAEEVVRRAMPLDLQGSAAAEARLVLRAPVGGRVRVAGSKTLLARALRNLVENALQYSPQESRVVVEIDAPAGGRVVLRVVDRGMGIPESEIPRIFDPFFRGERSRSRRTGGVGFGLTLTREIVRRHGGEIGVESGVGQGTTVTLTLPALSAS